MRTTSRKAHHQTIARRISLRSMHHATTASHTRALYFLSARSHGPATGWTELGAGCDRRPALAAGLLSWPKALSALCAEAAVFCIICPAVRAYQHALVTPRRLPRGGRSAAGRAIPISRTVVTASRAVAAAKPASASAEKTVEEMRTHDCAPFILGCGGGTPTLASFTPQIGATAARGSRVRSVDLPGWSKHRTFAAAAPPFRARRRWMPPERPLR